MNFSLALRASLEATIAELQSRRAALGDELVDAALAPLLERLSMPGERTATTETRRRLRQVSVLFLDIVGSTQLTQTLDPEAVQSVVDGALATYSAIVARHGGEVLRYAGDSIKAVFGAHDMAGTREDDAERAVHCGLALLAEAERRRDEVQRAHGFEGFNVRVGIHTGAVVRGGGVERDNSLSGLAVNIAARLEQATPAGTLRISRDTHAEVRGLFEVELQPPLAAKGVDEPVQSYMVKCAKPRAFKATTRGIEGVVTRMVGRDSELEQLQAACRGLAQPGAGLKRVLVVAQVGVGKSRLLHEFDAWARTRPEPVLILQARATPQSQAQPYGILRDLLARHWDVLDGDSIEVARKKLEDGVMPLFMAEAGEAEARAHAHLLGQLIGLDFSTSPHLAHILDDGRQIRDRGLHAAAKALRRLSAPVLRDGSGVGTGGDTGGAAAPLPATPIVMQIDDLQWADDASLDFFDDLVQVNDDVPILLLGLARPTLFERRPEPPHVMRVDLQPLDKADSDALVNELLKALPAVPAVLRDVIAGRADGNPYYMEELVRMLVDKGAIRTDSPAGQGWTFNADMLNGAMLPATLTGVLQARLDALPPPQRHALQLASVIGLHFWDAILAHIEAQAAEQLGPLQARELVSLMEGADARDTLREFAFTHQLLHQVTYDTVLKAPKREAHAKAAQWLAQHSGPRAQSFLSTAAMHYEKAGDSANAAEYFTRAAEHHAGNFAHQQVLDSTDRALALAAPHDAALRWRALAARERALDMLAQRESQRQAIESLMKLAEGLDDDRRRAEAALRHCDLALRCADYAVTRKEAQRAQAAAERIGDEELVLVTESRLAMAMAYQGQVAGGRALAEAGMVRARTLGGLVLQARLCNAAAVCADLQGDIVSSLRHNLTGTSLAREAGNRRSEAVALGNAGNAYYFLGDHGSARHCLESALQLSRTVASRQLEGNILASLSCVAWSVGEHMTALSLAQVALDSAVATGGRVVECSALWARGNAELALGRWTPAQQAFERYELLAREIGAGVRERYAIEGQIRVALAQQDLPQAVRTVERMLANISAANSVPLTQTLAGDFRIRLTLHQVWCLARDPRADAALAEAHSELTKRAAAITDDTLRRSFLENVPEHREIVTLWRASSQE